jgi:hypothetical protein
MVKAILGYDIMPGISVEEYERWLRSPKRRKQNG